MVNPDPRIFLDLRPLNRETDPAAFMSEWVGTLEANAPGAKAQAEWLAHIAANLPDGVQLNTTDPATLYVVGAAAGNGTMRRDLLMYLLAVERFTARAVAAHGGPASSAVLDEIHAATAK